LQYNKAPISRVISTKAKSTATYASPVSFSAGGVLGSTAVGLASGKAVTVFFEVPTCPIAASQINIKLHESATDTGCGIHAAPNVVMADADSYLYIRGNSVIANAGTPANGIHVVYSAILENVIAADRTANANSLVRAGDSLTIAVPSEYSASNITAVTSVTAQVISVRHKGQNTYLIDFTVGVNPSLVTTPLTGWDENEVLFYNGTAGSPTAYKGLAKDQLSAAVTGTSGASTVWRGAIRSAVNLSYPSANKDGILPIFDSSETTTVTKAWVASSGLPSVNKALSLYSDIDYNSGAMPFKCISIVDNTPDLNFYNLEVSIVPLY
jgi:hypothetical protein